MAAVEWKPLPTPMWPEGSVMADLPGLILEVSFEEAFRHGRFRDTWGKMRSPTWQPAARLTASRLPRQRRCTSPGPSHNPRGGC